MKYKIVISSRFSKDLKIIAKRGYNLVYEIKDDKLILFLVRTGTHSDLF